MALRRPGQRSSHPLQGRLGHETITRVLARQLSDRRRRRINRVVDRRLGGLTVLLEDLYDPHNGAAVLRSCEAFGLLHVHVVPGPEGFSISQGVTQSADKWLDVYVHRSIDDAINYLQGAGFRCWAAVPPPLEGEQLVPIERCSAGARAALMFGNEHAGLSERAIALADGCFNLPMFGFSESLNLSVAAALAIQAACTARRERIGRAGDLTPAARAQLRAAYYALALDNAPDLLLRHLSDAVAAEVS